jgi:release factor glutamine methyltransferase
VSQEQTPSTESWTIGRLLAWAAKDFKERGLESPRLEAEVLLGDLLALDRVRLIVEATRPLSAEELSAFRDRIKRRRGGEPSAYIIGKREFFGREFLVDSRVLIPRPDTEILVEEALERTAHRDLDGRALDLCTGSGCVALSFALKRRTWKVTGTDLDPGALEVARKNAQNLGALWGVRFVEGDLFGALDSTERFEMITANPPYIPSSEVLELETGVKDFEPNKALDGGADGLDFYPRVTAGALKHLVPGGVLALELGAGQASAVAQILKEAGFTDVRRKKDYGGHERVVSGRAPITSK